MIEELKTDYERADYLLSVLSARATGELADDQEYTTLRSYFINSAYANLIPTWLRSKHNLGQFWPYIQSKFVSYKERRKFLHDELSPLLDATEGGLSIPIEKTMSSIIESPSYESISSYWNKCTERVSTDPDGAVTAARALIETVLKHIVEDLNIEVEKNNPDLSELYSSVASKLNLSPQLHKEKLFKSILSGCNSIVSGIGEIRNLYGDAHGKNRKAVKLEPRHAHLAVNLAGSMASFLIETAEKAKQGKPTPTSLVDSVNTNSGAAHP